MRSRVSRALAVAAALALLPVVDGPVLANHEPGHARADQGLGESEEGSFADALGILLADDDTDLVITVRRQSGPRAGCVRTGEVYWVYSARGTICFTRSPAGERWSFDVQVVKGANPVAERSHTAIATLGEERAASSRTVQGPQDPLNLVDPGAITYPFVYERIVAEFDSPRAGDFAIVPDNTADRGGPGAHGHPGQVQSRSTLLVSGRGARRSPLGPAEEASLRVKHVDIAPTVAEALGVNPYFVDTGQPGRTLNGKPSASTLLKRQDGRVLDDLLEPVFNTFVVVVDGLRPEDVTPALMPNLTGLVSAPCEPGGVCATEYTQARAIMVSETGPNHVAMMTGAYGEAHGFVGDDIVDRATGEVVGLERPEQNLAETLYDAIETQKPWLRTALVGGKETVREFFDCSRDGTGDCGTSTANPEGVPVTHVRPDFVGGASAAPTDPEVDCPAEPATSGYADQGCTMDVALDFLRTHDPDFTLINLGLVDGFSHLHGAGSPTALAQVASADTQIGRLVDALKASGKWQHSTLIVSADHNFGSLSTPLSRITLSQVFLGVGPSPFEVVTTGGYASVYLTDLPDPSAALTAGQQATLRDLRARALATPGIVEALYRRPNPLDGGAASTIDAVHPDWRLGGSARIGELMITADEAHTMVASPTDSQSLLLGEHGRPTDRHVPFVVASGGTYVRDATVAPTGPVDQADDTAANPGQAETVDVAPTIAWLLGVDPPAQSAGRVLSEAFVKHPLAAQADGTITEPIANRAAIFSYDQNNSVNVHCLLDPSTCGDPVPAEATDPAWVPNLRALAANGSLTTYGSIAAWPSSTFPNHNVVGSGAYPGHHGIPNNRFYVREEKKVEEPINPQGLDYPIFHFSNALLSPDIETLHEAVHRTYGDWDPLTNPDGAFTASVNEPSARGADYATLEPQDSFPNPETYGATGNPVDLLQDMSQPCFQVSPSHYGLESLLDHFGQTQARRLFDALGQATTPHPLPKYLINNFTLTDGSGHEFGAHATCNLAAYRDGDRRLGRILGAMDEGGVLGETLIVVTGDHGAENQDLERRGLPSDFAALLNENGIEHVMADWQVYLQTLDVVPSTTTFRVDREVTVTFTVRDEDDASPVESATVRVEGVEGGTVAGTTAADGTVTLTFTPRAGTLTVRTSHPEFNERVQTYSVNGTGGMCRGTVITRPNLILGTPEDEVLVGTEGRDVICAFGGNDRLFGLGGTDILVGGRGADEVRGGAGNDDLRGREGNDRLFGDSGHDSLDGGRDRDRCIGGPGRNTLRSCEVRAPP